MRKNQSPKGKEVIEIPAKSRHEILNIPKQKLRVCAYCRVSTDLEAQESSYESQLQFYTKYISDNPNWVTFITIDGEEEVFSLKPRGGHKKPPTKK